MDGPDRDAFSVRVVSVGGCCSSVIIKRVDLLCGEKVEERHSSQLQLTV